MRYSQICAQVVRQCLKADLREAATKRSASTVKTAMWKDGKPVDSKFVFIPPCQFSLSLCIVSVTHIGCNVGSRTTGVLNFLL